MIRIWITYFALVLTGLRGESDTLSITITIEDVQLALDDDIIPTKFRMYPASPNPFNNQVVLKWDLAEESSVQLTIFDIQGRKIWNKDYGISIPGRYSARWNGLDSFNQPVATGIYFVRIETIKNIAQQKVLYLK